MLKRMEPWAAVKGTPMALSTCEGSRLPEVQAEPEEAQIPTSFSNSRMAYPSTYSKLMLVVLGRRSILCPFSLELSIWYKIRFSSLSRSFLTFEIGRAHV